MDLTPSFKYSFICCSVFACIQCAAGTMQYKHVESEDEVTKRNTYFDLVQKYTDILDIVYQTMTRETKYKHKA